MTDGMKWDRDRRHATWAYGMLCIGIILFFSKCIAYYEERSVT